MKRSSIIALLLGALVSATVIALHATGVTLPLEEAMTSLLARGQQTTKVVSVKAQYALVIALSLCVVWLVSKSSRPKRLGWPLGFLAAELIAMSWVCLLYHVFFQPLPSLLAIGLGLVTGSGFAAFGARVKPDTTPEVFAGNSAEGKTTHLPPADVASEARSYDITAVVCDIANKHDIAEDCSPAEYAEITARFIHDASESFLNAGAHIDTANGEGIVAIFGFPEESADHAEKATRHSLSLVESLGKLANSDGATDNIDVHLGISSGTVIAAPIERKGAREVLLTGEPVELARRFCIANRGYGSRILVGPRTFELTSKHVLARPVDFLSGVDAHERHEIYEPLTLAADATAEQIARRDSFWNGVVLYREKRWADAYSEFQKARGPDETRDAPLRMYLHRIEPLALDLAMTHDNE
ncbi:MAG: adenylate/guanylate cyclase domain-containing protein [Chthoniobacterales bacterium]|nr:adenylate/guanylate cyclase domain-containing protein [Chthoniobacterales bacterium]